MAIRWSLEQVHAEWCAENLEGGLTPAERLVLVSLAHHHNEQTGRCDPGQGRIARETGIHARSVSRCVRSLERKGLITWRRRWWDAGRLRPRSNYYELSLEVGAPLPDTSGPQDRTPPTRGHHPPDERTPERKENVQENAAATKKKKGASRKEVQAVFDSWAQSLQDGTTPRLTPRRADLIARSLEHSTLEELARAVKSWPHTEFHSGRKYGKGPQNRLDQLLQDRESVEQLNNAGLVREKQELAELDSLALDRYEKPYAQLTEAEQAAVRKRRQEDSW